MQRFQLSSYLFCAVFFIVIFQSCRTTGRISMSVYEAPLIDMPDHIRNIGIINRSTAADNKGKQVFNTIEGILSGEGINEDKKGASACMRGAERHLNMDTFVRAELMEEYLLQGGSSGIMAAPLDWLLVDTICATQQKDALLVLEVFDTDQEGSVTSQAVGELARVALSGGQARPNMPSANNNPRVQVKMGWRLYDAKTHQIIDEARLSDFFAVRSRSNNPIYDLGEFAKRDAIQQSAFIAGRSYCTRLFPSWIRVQRSYFRRSGPEMKAARRMIQVNDWDAARAVWIGLSESPKRKKAGRALYNLALYYELKGDLETAMMYANKSYTRYNIRKARDYARLLRYRRNRQLQMMENSNR